MWELITKQIVIKENDPELYRIIKAKLNKKNSRYLEIFSKLEWNVEITPECIRLKAPVLSEREYMAIESFKDVTDYVLLSAVYYYLNTIAAGTVFTAEDVIEHIKIICEQSEVNLDMDQISTKHSLYRTLVYCEKKDYLRKLDGDALYLINEDGDGVLYKNTGYSKNLRVNSKKEIHTEAKVYRSLLTEPIIYHKDFEKKEVEYLREHIDQIEDDIRFLCDKDINLISQEEISCLLYPDADMTFPKNNQRDQFLTRTITYIREKVIRKGKVTLTENEFKKVIEKVRRIDGDIWTKEYQSLSTPQLVRIAKQGLKDLKAMDESNGSIMIMPLSSMIQGELN